MPTLYTIVRKASVVLLLCSPALAQTAALGNAAGKDPASIRFEVVSIRQCQAGSITRGEFFTASGFSMRCISPRSLLSAFGIQRVAGIPEWATSVSYDIAAKVPEADVTTWAALSFAQKRAALVAMMEDRFQLKWRRETRMTPGYLLEVSKTGPKFKEAAPGDAYPRGFKDLHGTPLTGVLYETGPGVFSAQAITMDALADQLQVHAGKPVKNGTGLTGKYDLTFKRELPARPTPGATDPAMASEPTGDSIFTVIQEQLGLKLSPGAEVPVELLMVDRLERPTEN